MRGVLKNIRLLGLMVFSTSTRLNKMFTAKLPSMWLKTHSLATMVLFLLTARLVVVKLTQWLAEVQQQFLIEA